MKKVFTLLVFLSCVVSSSFAESVVKRSFQAEVLQEGVHFTWKTEYTTLPKLHEFRLYEISTHEPELLATIQQNGTQQYTLILPDQQAGERIYRIEEIVDGEVIYQSEAIRVNSNNQQTKIFPNLVETAITVQTEVIANLMVYTITGIKVKEMTILVNNQQVSLDSLLPGQYIALLEDSKGKRYIQRLIKR